jgi:hypothetical protein
MSITANTDTKNVIRIDDGLRRVPIENMFDQEVGVFYFRPTDIGIMERYNKLMSEFDSVLAPLEKADIGRDGEAADPTDMESVNAIKEAKEKLNSLLDELFDGNFSEAFFGKMNPFSPVGGRFYCEQAIELVGAYIEQEFGIEAEQMSSKVEKYTGPYEVKK